MAEDIGESVRRGGVSIVGTIGVGLILLGVTLEAGCKGAGKENAAKMEVGENLGPVKNSIGMWMAPVRAGEFVMGSPVGEAGHDADEVEHRVRITKGFWLGVYPVTQREYVAVMGTNPSYFRGEELADDLKMELPVDSVSWFEAVAFCEKLSEKEGRKYRLPTEAEREYACRAGERGAYAGGKLDEIGWYLGNSGDRTHPVGMMLPNGWGFYDMQGNVWEWCADWYGPYAAGEAVDPTGPERGTTRVLRGGSMGYDPEYARAGFRNYYLPESKAYHNGFRVARDW